MPIRAADTSIALWSPGSSVSPEDGSGAASAPSTPVAAQSTAPTAGPDPAALPASRLVDSEIFTEPNALREPELPRAEVAAVVDMLRAAGQLATPELAVNLITQ